MRRRELLAGTAVTLLAGCLRDGRGAAPGAEGPPSADGTTAESPSIEETRFELSGGGCGTARERASVTADGAALTVTVEGTTSARNACHSARLADAGVDGDEVRVVVETYDASDGDGVCAQCITELDYAATVSFAGRLPARVAVVHRSRDEEREVAATELGGASAGQFTSSTSESTSSTSR